MRILIVDDDMQVRNCLADVLRQYGSVDEAENGRDAVFKFIKASTEGIPYRIVLLDFEMPVMNGNDALHMIRLYEQDHPDPNHVTTVLITSGRGDCDKLFGDMLRSDPHLHLLNKPLDFRWLNQFFVSFSEPAHANELHAPGI